MVVVDTNVLAYLLVTGDQTHAAQTLFSQDDDWHTEPFAIVEFSNLLATACRTRGLSFAQARSLLETAEELLQDRTHAVAHQTALAVANEFAISAYDARFVAVAAQFDTQLITEDARLRRAVPQRTRSIAEATGEH
jgi:predicted nucleic acid-binding protein